MNTREPFRPYPLAESHEILSTDPFYDAIVEQMGAVRMVMHDEYEVERDAAP